MELVALIGLSVLSAFGVGFGIWAMRKLEQSLNQSSLLTRTIADATAQRDEARRRLQEVIAQSRAERAGLEALIAELKHRAQDEARPQPEQLPDSIFRYARVFGLDGTGPFSIPDRDDMLFRFHPGDMIKPIGFVKSLTMHVSTDHETHAGASTLDFMISSPSGGWMMNGGKNKISWGENDIEIKYPDSYVARTGDIFFSIRNYGPEPVSFKNLIFTMVAEDVDGTTSHYAPTNDKQ